MRILTTVGKWMAKNNAAIYGTKKSRVNFSNVAGFTRKGNKLYSHVYFWPGSKITIGGLETNPKSVKLLATGKDVPFTHSGTQLTFTDLPAKAPDDPVTVFVAEFDAEPVQKSLAVRVIDIINEIESHHTQTPTWGLGAPLCSLRAAPFVFQSAPITAWRPAGGRSIVLRGCERELGLRCRNPPCSSGEKSTHPLAWRESALQPHPFRYPLPFDHCRRAGHRSPLRHHDGEES